MKPQNEHRESSRGLAKRIAPLLLSLMLGLSTGCVSAQKETGAGLAQKENKGAVKEADDNDEPEIAPTNAPPAKGEPIKIVRPKEVHEKSMSGQYQFYLGNLHAHSGYSGDHAKTIANKFNKGVANYNLHTPAEIFAKARTNYYDFYFMSDHSSPEQTEFYRNGFTDEHWLATKLQAAKASTSNFVALRGYEFSRNVNKDNGGLGHMNVLNSADWNSAYAPGHTFNWLYDWLTPQSNVVAMFNHPARPGIFKVKNFNNYAGRTKARNEVVRLVEIWNSGEKMGYVPTVKKIWALGWKVAPTAGTDVHGPFGVDKKRLRTGILAESLTPQGVMEALKARRVYATLEPTLHLEFTLNGVMMGTALDNPLQGDLKAKVFVNDPGGIVISKVELYGGHYEGKGEYKKLASIPVGKRKKIVEASVPSGYDFYYVAAFKQGLETARAFSAPIWMDNN